MCEASLVGLMLSHTGVFLFSFKTGSMDVVWLIAFEGLTRVRVLLFNPFKINLDQWHQSCDHLLVLSLSASLLEP